MQGPAPSQAAQQATSQGQHHAALSQPAQAPDSAAVANTATESAPPMAAESAALVTAAEAPLSMVAGAPSPRPADVSTGATAESASVVAGGGAEEEAREGTGRTPIVDSLAESTVAESRLLLSVDACWE